MTRALRFSFSLTRRLAGLALVLAGATAVGATGCDGEPTDDCIADNDCGSGERCNLALDAPACQALHTGAEWTPCSGDDLCASERCLVRSSRVCVEPGWQRLGEACERDDDCMTDLVCHTDATCETDTVARRVRPPRD